MSLEECVPTTNDHHGDVMDQIVCILTYGGNSLHCWINYTLLTIDLTCLILWWWWCHTRRKSIATTTRRPQEKQQEQRPVVPPSLQSTTISRSPALVEPSAQQSPESRHQCSDNGTNDHMAGSSTNEMTTTTTTTTAVPLVGWLPPLTSLVFVILFQIGLCLVVGCSGISIVWCACLGWYFHKKTSAATTSTTKNKPSPQHEPETEQAVEPSQESPRQLPPPQTNEHPQPSFCFSTNHDENKNKNQNVHKNTKHHPAIRTPNKERECLIRKQQCNDPNSGGVVENVEPNNSPRSRAVDRRREPNEEPLLLSLNQPSLSPTSSPLQSQPNRETASRRSANGMIIMMMMERFVILLNALALLYYAWIMEPITTIAHGCAIVLGVVVSRLEDIITSSSWCGS